MAYPRQSALELSGFKMRQAGISKRVKKLTVSAIKEMMHLAQGIPGVISLAQGTPTFLTPHSVRFELGQELMNNPQIGKYAPFAGLPVLKSAIASKLKRQHGIKVNSDTEILVTVGAMEAVAAAILTVVDPKDEVLIFSPGFPSHIMQIELAEGRPIFIPLNEAAGWTLDLAAFKNKISARTKAVVICNPNNPTGSLLTEQDLRSIAVLAKKNGFWIITDEPYDFLVYDRKAHFSILQISEIRNQLIACYSFSKEYAMSGFRVGYIYAAADVVNQMLKVHDALALAAATPSQYAATLALTHGTREVSYFVKEFAKRRALICRRLDQLPDLFSYQTPAGTYYIFVKIHPPFEDYQFALDMLKEAKVAAVPGSAFGPTGKRHLRFCFAQTEDVINEAFNRIEKWWSNKKMSKSK